MPHTFFSYDGNEMFIANATGKARVVGKIKIEKRKTDESLDEKKILSEIESERKKLRAAFLAGKPRTQFAQRIVELSNQLDNAN